jgi:hypothetical protein
VNTPVEIFLLAIEMSLPVGTRVDVIVDAYLYPGYLNSVFFTALA